MRLQELEPRWLSPNVFVFLCPHCRQILLSCKNAPMLMRDQFALFAKELGEEDWNQRVVPTTEGASWMIAGSMPELTVLPSIDASASGHWHGHIRQGEIV